jgi:hypothetical protein
MSIFQCTEIQVDKPRVFPSGHHGQICKVGEYGIVAIEYNDGAMIVSAIKDGKESQFIVRDWLHGKLAAIQPSAEFSCKDCGEVFKNSQGLGKHVLGHKKV